MNYTKYMNHVATLILLIGISSLYRRYTEKFDIDNEKKQNEIIQKYLLQDDSLAIIKKPIMWIHIDHVPNSRFWESFGSRTSNNFNEPYQFLTIKSIINKCGDSFKIVFVDDNTFNKIIPEWTHNMSMIPDPIKSYFRELAMAKLLYTYGGIVVPSSLICIKSLDQIYHKGTINNKMFVGEFYNKNVTNQSGLVNFFPHTRFMGGQKQNPEMLKLINYIEILISKDNTHELEFDGKISRKCFELVNSGAVNKVDAEILGGLDTNQKYITLEDLMGSSYISIPSSCSAIYIPSNDLSKRINYQWFTRLSVDQVLESNTMLGKLLLTNTF
jgi:hypothetical protein